MMRSFQLQPEVEKFRFMSSVRGLIALAGRDKFLQLDLLELKKNNPTEFVVEMMMYSEILALFADAEVLDKFKSVGFNKRTLQWFIPLEVILQKWEDIILKEEVGLLDGTCFEIIENFVGHKIKREVLTWAIKEFPHSNFETYKGVIKNLHRRQATERKHSEKYIHKEHERLKELNEKIESKVENKEGFKKLLRKMELGKADSIFVSTLLQWGFRPLKDIGAKEYVYQLSPLIRKLLQDVHLIEKHELNSLRKAKGYDEREEVTRRILKMVGKDFDYELFRPLFTEKYKRPRKRTKKN